MKVRIIKASKPTYWYADKIGRTFSVKQCIHSGGEDTWDTFDDEGCLVGINKEDCEVVD